MRALTRVSVATLALALVVLAHGFLPGMLNNLAAGYVTEGGMQCVHDLGLEALTSWCHAYGEPLGYPFLTGGPLIALGAGLMYLPGVGSYEAYLLSGICFDAIALAGGYGLMRRLGSGCAVALGTAIVYLVAPTVIGLEGFVGTFTGFALLPAYAFVDLIVIDAVGRRAGRGIALAIAGYAAVKTGALFLDGYSFIAGNLVSALLWGAWLLRPDAPRRAKGIGVAALVGANLVALGAYLLYVPGSYEQNPLGIFRSMGLDLVTLVMPTEYLWPASELGIATSHTDLWGDGSNSSRNYAGFAVVVLAIIYLARPPRDRRAVAIGVAGLIALLLAIGPTLKVDEVRPPQTGSPTFESYLMPEGVGVDLPWGGLFTAVPGVDSMRASYRWFGVTRLALIVLAGLAITALARRPGRGRVLVVVLAGIAAIELAPNLPLLTPYYRDNHREMNQFRSSVSDELDAATSPGERAFFLTDDGRHNDYLANYLASRTGLRAFNAGGDKNARFARARWPAEIEALALPGVRADDVFRALETDSAEVVIAPSFHLRLAAYAWPPSPEQTARARAAFGPVLADPRFSVDRYPWFATIRLPN